MMRHSVRHPIPKLSEAGIGGDTTIETALDWAETAGMLGDYREAVSWLVYIEWCRGSLTPELEQMRARWERAAGSTAE